RLKVERIEFAQRQERFRNIHRSVPLDMPVKTIDDFRKDPKYASDGNRIDLAYALYALSHGIPEEDVRAALCSRDLQKKGTADRQRDYVDRTIQKARAGAMGKERRR